MGKIFGRFIFDQPVGGPPGEHKRKKEGVEEEQLEKGGNVTWKRGPARADQLQVGLKIYI